MNTVSIDKEQYEQFQKFMVKEEKRKSYQKRVAIKNQIYVEKAKAAGIEVTDEEINARINRNNNMNVINDADDKQNNNQEENV